MAININVNGESINYPQTGDTNWSDEATDFAVQTASAFGKIGLSSGTTVDIPGTLDVTGNTTLDANLSVTGNATITGNLTANGNTNLGNASGDTIAVAGILNVDSGVLYVNPTSNQVGINKTNPSQALDVVGNVAVTGNETVGGTLGVTGDVAVNTNKFNITATSGNTTIAGTLGVTGDVAINTNKFNVTASSGNTTIAGQILSSDGTSLLPGISFSSDPNTGLYSIGADKIGFSANGARVGEFGDGYGGFVGNVIQVAYAEITTSGASSAVNIPVDNTIPQQTEGAEILTCSITPKYANSILYVESNSFIGENTNSSNSITVALFRDSNANAVSVSFNNGFPSAATPYGANLSFNPTYLLHKSTAGSTAPTTFKLRAGGELNAAIRWNGTGGNQFFNGTLITYIRITEVQV